MNPSQIVVTTDVFRSERTVVRAGRTAEGVAVIVKTPAAAIPDASELAQYRRERAFLGTLAGPGIPAVIDLIEDDGTVRLVMEYRGGRSLAEWMAERRLGTAEVLGVLEETAVILARVHAAGVIHKDIAPANLVWGGRADSLQLVDFGMSANEGAAATPGRLEGTLRYIAPEATGRTAHAVTWRTDLYGLGATAWHLLTGRPPFEDDDSLALVHAHLARAPEAPHRVDPTLPPCLSAVVLRLLEKNPERRYQSAEGLIADLRRCREAIGRGEPAPFDLCRDDAPPRFAIPDLLYGREAEMAALTSALDPIGTRGVSLALVAGASGIGKSALVASLADHGRSRGVRMVRGRFEQIGRDTPLKAVSEACEALVAGLLALDEGALAETRQTLREALGDASGLLARAIPSLGALLGELPAAPELGDQASAVRAMQAHAALFGAIASAARPVVAFLDDLQWADAASLELVEFLVTSPDIRGLLIIGGYRDDAVGPVHPLTRMRERIEAMGVPITRVCPGPLDLASTTALVADACRCTPAVAAPLAEALRERTGGNPFFLRTLLHQMNERGWLRREGRAWCWSADAPQRLDFADNVVDAVLERLEALPTDTARALGVAARMGHRFDVRLLSLAMERPETEVAASLAPGIAARLIRPDSAVWDLLAWGAGVDSSCHFVHDRVQEAALRLVPPEEAPAVHLRLARLLTRGGMPKGEALFDALEHYRNAQATFDDDERTRIARLALEACSVAVRSAAVDTALRACEFGLATLDHRDPALWETLCTRAVEVAEASSNDEALDRHAVALIAGASSVAATAPAYVARIRAQVRGRRYAEVIETANSFLVRFERRVYTRLRILPLLYKLARVLWAMRGRTPEQLVDGKEGKDPAHVAVMSVLIPTSSALAFAYPAVLPYDILFHIDEVLTRGVTPDAVFAWTGWAFLVAEGLHRPELAIRYCELALARAERLGSRTSSVAIALALYGILDHWRSPLPTVVEGLRRTRDRALEIGEATLALNAGGVADQIAFMQGSPLAEVDLALRQTQDLARQYRNVMWVVPLAELRHAVAVLRGESDRDTLPDPETSDALFSEMNHATLQLILALFVGDREAGWRAARDAPAREATPLRNAVHLVWWTYRAVALLRAAARGYLTPRSARQRIRPGRRLLARWATAIPSRRYRLLWIDATDAALRGDHAAALTVYEQAIEMARSMGIRHDAALMAEHAAEVAAASGRQRLQRAFLEEACAGYRQWGATRKVDQIAAMLPGSATSSTTISLSGDMDLETLFRASLALSGEIRLDRLVGDVVAVTLQNAGATRGFLIAEREGALVVEVGRDADGAVLVAPSTPLAGVAGLATSVVQYVARTGEQLVLADGAADGRFAADPYLQGRTPPSILCAPLVHKGHRTGIIYLENHLVSGAFTPARLKTVQVLASQAAVAIQNASLVEQLESKVAQRTHALQDALAHTRAQHAKLVVSQHALVQSEKMASLGQLAASIAHEINTPLGAIGASVGNIAAALDQTVGTLPTTLAAATPAEIDGLRALLRASERGPAALTSREERARRAAVQRALEARALPSARGVADALVAMGVEEPLDEHIPLLQSPRHEVLLRAASNLAALRRNSNTIRTAADRASKTVFALKSFVHPGGAQGELAEGSLVEHLDTVLTLYRGLMKSGIELARDYTDPGVVFARHDELNQVWTNLLQNALQAMEGGGELRVAVHPVGEDSVRVEITDNGPGIPSAVQDRIFEPFFTTKRVGEGSGLGLSISRDIVNRHGGTLGFETRPGRTTFSVQLPRRPPVSEPASG